MSKIKLELTKEELSMIQFVLTNRLESMSKQIQTNGKITDEAMQVYVDFKGLISKIDAYCDIDILINSPVPKSNVNETYSTQSTIVKPVDYEYPLASQESQFRTSDNMIGNNNQVYSDVQPVSNIGQTDNFNTDGQNDIQEKVFKVN